MSQLPSEDDERITAFGLFLESHSALVQIFDQHLQSECGLSLRWFEVLLRLARTAGECLPAGELGRAISLTSGATTRRIDRLVEAGLIERRTSNVDRRVIEICLTDQGRLILAEAVPVHLADLDRHLVDVLGSDNMASFAASLRQLRDQLRGPSPLETDRAIS